MFVSVCIPLAIFITLPVSFGRDTIKAVGLIYLVSRTTLWVEEWNALGDRSTEWRDRGIIPNEHLASGTDEPWSTWRSLNRQRVQ